jgi:hypothetical protein
MPVGVRVGVGQFVVAWTMPIAVACCVIVIGVAVLLRWPVSVAVTLCGLIADALGAVTTAWGILGSSAAHLRNSPGTRATSPDAMTASQRRWARFPAAFAIRFGSKNPADASPTVIEDMVDTFWGLLMLCLGFLAQAVAVILQQFERNC